MNNADSFRSILTNKKFVLLLTILSVFLIVSTALISTYVVKNRSGYEYLAVINEDLSFIKSTLLEKQNSICNQFDAKTCEQPGKYEPINDQAKVIEFETNELIILIDEIIEDIIDDCGGNDNNFTESMEDKGDFSAASKVFENSRDAKELHRYLADYKRLLLQNIYDTSSTSYKYVNESLNFLNSLTTDEYQMDQEVLYSGMPSVATINLLLQLQIKIRLSAIETLQYMLYSFESLDLRITGLSVYNDNQNERLFVGDTYVSKIGLLAIDTTMRPIVYISYSKPFYDSIVIERTMDYRLVYGQNYDILPFKYPEGTILEIKCTKPGKHHYGGLIHYVSNRGDIWLPFNGEYVVQ